MNFNAQDLVRIRVNGKLVKGFPETGPNKRGISRRGMAANIKALAKFCGCPDIRVRVPGTNDWL